jgi:hypothetical protein
MSTYVDDWRRKFHRTPHGAQGDLLKPTDIAVASTLADFATYETGKNVRPSHSKVAKALGVSVRTVSRSVQALIQSGWMRQVVKAVPGKAAIYELTFPDESTGIAPTEGTERSPQVSTESQQTTSPPGDSPDTGDVNGRQGSPERSPVVSTYNHKTTSKKTLKNNDRSQLDSSITQEVIDENDSQVDSDGVESSGSRLGTNMGRHLSELLDATPGSEPPPMTQREQEINARVIVARRTPPPHGLPWYWDLAENELPEGCVFLNPDQRRLANRVRETRYEAQFPAEPDDKETVSQWLDKTLGSDDSENEGVPRRATTAGPKSTKSDGLVFGQRKKDADAADRLRRSDKA